MSTKLFPLLSALSGIVGVIMLITSFSINPGPPSNATSAQLIAFGNQYYTSILWGAWLQAVGPLLIVLFAFAIVFLAGATTRLAGWMTLFGGTTLMAVSLIEITFYMSALNTTPINNNPAAMGLISLALIHSVQHLYFIVGAPALFIPLGVVSTAPTRVRLPGNCAGSRLCHRRSCLPLRSDSPCAGPGFCQHPGALVVGCRYPAYRPFAKDILI